MRLNAQKIYKDGYLKDNYSQMPLQARQGAIIALDCSWLWSEADAVVCHLTPQGWDTVPATSGSAGSWWL